MPPPKRDIEGTKGEPSKGVPEKRDKGKNENSNNLTQTTELRLVKFSPVKSQVTVERCKEAL